MTTMMRSLVSGMRLNSRAMTRLQGPQLHLYKTLLDRAISETKIDRYVGASDEVIGGHEGGGDADGDNDD